MFQFKDKHVFISGGGSGIGFRVARSFLQAGAKVIISGRRESTLKKAADSLRDELKLKDEQIRYCKANLAKSDDMKVLIDFIKSSIQTLDIVINNSGCWGLKEIAEFDADFVNDHIDNNLKTTLHGMQLADKFMSSGGSIVNMASFAGIMPMKGASLYSALKSSIIALTRSGASEFAQKDIRVNCVIPGVIRTPMTSDHIDEHYERIIKPIALGRVGDTQDIANGVMFLCSDYASYITGTSLDISGGKYITQL
jgi:3-oxoacyl-[acyl-carrier protein] reductase